MSEFSESYHLLTNKREHAIKLIKDSENNGFVYEETNGWVTFLIKGSAFEKNESIIFWNPGLMVHYIYAEDHGWELNIFNKNEIVFAYKCDWSDEVTINKEIFELEVLRILIAKQGNSFSGLEELFDYKDSDLEEPSAYQLAEMLGLVHYEWLAADYFNMEKLPDGVIFVD